MKKINSLNELRIVYQEATHGSQEARKWLREHPFHLGTPILIAVFIFILLKGNLPWTLTFGSAAVWAAANLLHDHLGGR